MGCKVSAGSLLQLNYHFLTTFESKQIQNSSLSKVLYIHITSTYPIYRNTHILKRYLATYRDNLATYSDRLMSCIREIITI